MRAQYPILAARFSVTAMLALSLAFPALADKPDGVGRGKGSPPAEHGKGGPPGKGGGEDSGSDIQLNVDIRFGSGDRIAVRDYFDPVHGRGCPPGLAKKNNGCMPPGQARKWAIGRPLPRDLVFYDLPSDLVVKLRPPPSGYRYVRIAADILIIAVGTGMVIDAIQDLGRL